LINVRLKEIKKFVKQDNSELPEVKVALLEDTDTQFLDTVIKGVGVERGCKIKC
jgi:hypothetical protein